MCKFLKISHSSSKETFNLGCSGLPWILSLLRGALKTTKPLWRQRNVKRIESIQKVSPQYSKANVPDSLLIAPLFATAEALTATAVGCKDNSAFNRVLEVWQQCFESFDQNQSYGMKWKSNSLRHSHSSVLHRTPQKKCLPQGKGIMPSHMVQSYAGQPVNICWYFCQALLVWSIG